MEQYQRPQHKLAPTLKLQERAYDKKQQLGPITPISPSITQKIPEDHWPSPQLDKENTIQEESSFYEWLTAFKKFKPKILKGKAKEYQDLYQYQVSDQANCLEIEGNEFQVNQNNQETIKQQAAKIAHQYILFQKNFFKQEAESVKKNYAKIMQNHQMTPQVLKNVFKHLGISLINSSFYFQELISKSKVREKDQPLVQFLKSKYQQFYKNLEQLFPPDKLKQILIKYLSKYYVIQKLKYKPIARTQKQKKMDSQMPKANHNEQN